MKKRYFAHSLEGKPEDEWHVLEDRLKETSELTANFVDEFGTGDLAVTDKIYRYWGKARRTARKGLNKSVLIFCHSLLL